MSTTSISITRSTGYVEDFNLVSLPSKPGPRSVQLTMNDAVAATRYPFTNVTRTQTWPGADSWDIQVTLPPMARCDAANWIAFLMNLRGQANVFQIGDLEGAAPLGEPVGAPLVDGTDDAVNTATSTTLYTKGWEPSTFRLLLPGSYLQIGYRLHMVLDVVNSDGSGKASFSVWPSLREQPADGTPITLAHTTGLFRLAANTRQWNYDVVQLYGISFRATEVL
jgi:hypothetical protein